MSVEKGVKTLEDIKLEIERATERRAELLHVLAEGHEPVVAAEHAQVEEEIDRDVIIKRARLEERLERAA